MRVKIVKKKRSKEDYTDKLEKEIRELKAINRSLMRQLKKISKGINKEAYDNALEELELSNEKKETKPQRNKCSECGKGTIVEVNIVGRIFHRCDTCGYKSGKIK